jgi:hypothetical protein
MGRTRARPQRPGFSPSGSSVASPPMPRTAGCGKFHDYNGLPQHADPRRYGPCRRRSEPI